MFFEYKFASIVNHSEGCPPEADPLKLNNSVKAEGTIRFFINGTQIGTDTLTADFQYPDNSLTIGQFSGEGAAALNGYRDDLYLRKGEARDQYEISSIYSIGNELREDLTSGLNDGGANQFSLGYTTQEISQLPQLYADGAGSVDHRRDLTWSYLGGTLPGDTGYAIGVHRILFVFGHPQGDLYQ